jgi:hypothetical protein
MNGTVTASDLSSMRDEGSVIVITGTADNGDR